MFDKIVVDSVEQKAQLDKATADAAEFKAGYDKLTVDAVEQKAQVGTAARGFDLQSFGQGSDVGVVSPAIAAREPASLLQPCCSDCEA